MKLPIEWVDDLFWIGFMCGVLWTIITLVYLALYKRW